jgi:CubicO group peptidase (beta-lactamase class C family)
MQLVEQGMLDLDTDINEYLDFEIPNRLEYKQRNVPAEPITIRHLMTHTPGFEDYMTEVFSISEESVVPLAQYVRESRPARVFAPGEVTAYSNYGATLAGYIVEVVSGTPFAQYIEENIYRPLGMNHSTFRQPIPEDLPGNMAKPYRFVDGTFMEASFEFMSEPAGSMSSSALDMARFMLAYLEEGQLDTGRVLQAGTVRRMFDESFTHHHELEGMAHGFIKATVNGQHVFQHPGGTMLYDTALHLIPEEGIGFFISHSGGSYLVNKTIFQQFMDLYFPPEPLIIPDPPAEMASRSAEFSGEYYQNRRSFTNSDAALSLLFGRIQVEVDHEGYLLVTHMGETHRFVEIEQGIYQNLSDSTENDYGGDFRTIVFGTDTLGRTMLMADGPMSYSRAAWYESIGPTLILLLSSLAFMIGSLIYWGIKSVVVKIRGKKRQSDDMSGGSKWAMRAAISTGLLTLVFLIGFLAEGEIDPVYQLPEQAYTPPSTFSTVLDATVPYALVFMSAGVIFFAVMAWVKGYWKKAGRIHYTLFALSSAVLSWMFYFWNIV